MQVKIYYIDGTTYEGECNTAPFARFLHREDGPAVEYSDGTKQWWLNGKLHREGGPAIECSSGTKYWYQSGGLHREDGPAVEYANGDKVWHLNGYLHRENGPAIERFYGTKEWWLNGELHREDGPAVERADGYKEWCLESWKYTKREFDEKLEEIDSLEPAVGLLDPREWVRNRWKRRLNNAS